MNQYLSGHGQKATRHHEWRTAENSAAHLLPILREKVAVQPELVLLDVGAGSGTITAGLAHHLPRGRVIALDLSSDILLKAAEIAKAQGLSNVETQQGSVYELPFGDGTIDLIHASMVLSHLADPSKAITEMMRVIKKPGGVIALSEADLNMWSYYPKYPGIAAYSRMLCTIHGDNGAHTDTAPQLVRFAMEAKVPRNQISASASAWCYSSTDEREMWGSTMIDRIQHGQVRQKALELGIVDDAALVQMAEDWKKWMEAEDAWFALLNGQIVIMC